MPYPIREVTLSTPVSMQKIGAGILSGYSNVIGMDDWDTVLRNPMLQVEALTRLAAAGGHLAADTTTIWRKKTNLLSDGVRDIAASTRLLEIIQSCIDELMLQTVFAHFVNITDQSGGAVTPKGNYDFILCLDADGCTIKFQLDVERTTNGVWTTCPLQWQVTVHGMRASVEAFVALLEEKAAPFTYTGDGEGAPIKTTIHSVCWNARASDTSSSEQALVFPDWKTQYVNYTPEVRTAVERLLQDPLNTEQGRLLIFHGAPGTGKTWFLRTLMHEWRDHYVPLIIQDVEFFMSDETYWAALISDISHNSTLRDKRPLVVLEDAGQGLIRNGSYGSVPIQRLLNRTDGLCIGDRNITFVITFNEEIGQVDPAVVRAGRCREKIHFTPLCRSDAAAWLTHHECVHLIPKLAEHTTLADLYAMKRGDSVKTTEATSRALGGFGFAEGGKVCTE